MRKTTILALAIYAAAMASFIALVAYEILHSVVRAIP